MSDGPDRFVLTMTVGASLQIKSGSGEMRDWIKPQTEASVSWPTVPSEAEIRVTAQWMEEKILNPTIEDFIATSLGKVKELNEGV